MMNAVEQIYSRKFRIQEKFFCSDIRDGAGNNSQANKWLYQRNSPTKNQQKRLKRTMLQNINRTRTQILSDHVQLHAGPTLTHVTCEYVRLRCQVIEETTVSVCQLCLIITYVMLCLGFKLIRVSSFLTKLLIVTISFITFKLIFILI